MNSLLAAYRTKLKKCAHAVMSALLVMASGNTLAGPEGGQVVGGTGSISHAGLNTTINQATQNMAINWQSYNVNVDERVQYIQPNSSSVSLNRILSNSGSTIAGRIDANGQVILVNPNGILFTPTAVVNVGGIIASGLDIATSDFMNGNYIFNEVLGTDGTVINSGTINASLGGNVALVGKQVENNGLIVANLGTVTLAAGKQAVLTFDQGGLLGVRVSEEILQEELGVDPAVVNSGDIEAEGGRVLLTASTSQDVFSQAVNTNGLDQATSVVVHEDGSFTLGGGADVFNSGTIDTSSTSGETDAGRIVLLGENVTSSGVLHADSANGDGGEIEIHSQDTTLLTESCSVTARSELNGQGGTVKVLGEKVGMFDLATVDVSGANGGGVALIGGDQQGLNSSVRNASYIYIGSESKIYANSLDSGDGGHVIAFASDTARIYGGLYARGGQNSGNGGFIETSGLQGFEILSVPDAGAASGDAGIWLIDPFDVTIAGGNDDIPSSIGGGTETFSPVATSTLGVNQIRSALNNNNVRINTGSSGTDNGDITFTSGANLNYDNRGARTLTLDAARNITFQAGSFIQDGSVSSDDSLNIILRAGGAVTLEAASGPLEAAVIRTQGGDFLVGSTTSRVANFTNNGTINTDAVTPNSNGQPGISGGGITVYSEGLISGSGTMSARGSDGNYDNGDNPGGQVGGVGGNIILSSNSGDISISGSITTNGGNGDGDNDTGGSRPDPASGGAAGNITLNAINGTVSVTSLTANGGTGIGAEIYGGSPMPTGGNAGNILITGASIQLNGNVESIGGLPESASATLVVQGNGGNVILNGSVVLGGDILSIDATGNTRGNICFADACTDPVSASIIDGNGTNLGNLSLTAGDVLLAGSVGSSTRIGDLDIDATGLVNAGMNNITANSFTVSQSASFESGTIDTSNTSGTAGNISITSAQITLHDDLNASGVTSGTVNLTLSSPGSVTLNRTSDFTSAATLIGSGGSDTLNAANRDNSWVLTGTSSTLNGNFSFSDIETLVGDDGIDTFQLHNSDSFAGTVNGNGGNSDEIIAGNRDTTWTIGGTNSGTVTGLSGAGDTFSNIEVLTGNDAQDTLVLHDAVVFGGSFDGMGGSTDTVLGGNRTATWTITGTNAANVTGINGGVDNVEILTGNANQDIFQLHDTIDFAGSVDGGGGTTDRLEGGNRLNTWSVTGADRGTATGLSGVGDTFINIENLLGNGGVDQFSYSGTLSGVMNGGAGTSDTLVIGTDGVTVELGDRTTTNLNVVGIETITANVGAGVDTLIADNTPNTWTIDTLNGGNINGQVNFENFSTLIGGSMGDQFEMSPSGVIASIDGGSASGNTLVARQGVQNTWSFNGPESGSLSQTIPLELYVAGFSNIQTFVGGGAGNEWANLSSITDPVNVENYFGFTGIIGSGTTSTLRGQDGQTNQWTLQVVADPGGTDTDGVNDGTFTNANGSLNFIDFANLIGGDGIDNYLISDSGSNTGQIHGGDTDTSSINTLTGRSISSTWTITSANSGWIDETVTLPVPYIQNFANIQELNGGAGDDTFTFSVTPATASLSVDGGGHTAGDSVSIAGLAGSVSIQLGSAGFSNIEIYTGNDTASTLIGENNDNTWTIGARHAGVVDGVSFTGFTTLQGGNNDDSFMFNVTPTVADLTLIGSGEVLQDSVNLAGLADPVVVQLGVTGFAGIEQITGNDINSTLIGDDIGNTWTISGNHSGSVDGTDFIGFTAVQGALTQDDSFNFTVQPGAADISIDGRGQASIDSVSLAALVGQTVTVQLGASGFNNIERFTGNNTNSTLTAGNTVNTWTINGINDGAVGGIAFIDFNNLNGGTGNDTFNYESGGGITGLINGGAGSDILNVNTTTATTVRLVDTLPAVQVINPANTLTVFDINTLNGNSGFNHMLAGPDVANAWAIGASNTGTVSFGPQLSRTTINFNGFRNLTGGAANDTFTLTSSTDTELVTGIIDGGGHATEDVLLLTGLSGTAANTVVRLGNTPTGGELNVTSIERIQGTGQGTLIAEDIANSWIINGDNDGIINQATANPVSFNNFASLVGGANDDSFQITSAGTITASIDGGDQVNRDTADYSSQEVVVVNFGSVSFNGITGLEGVRGNGTNSTLNGPATANATWSINDLNAGSISSAGTTLGFEGFNYLAAGTGDDTFTISNNGYLGYSSGAGFVPGMIAGGGGTNVLNVDLAGTGLVSGQVNYHGTGAQDTVNINNANSTPYTATYSPSVTVNDGNNSTNSGTYSQILYDYTNNVNVDTSLAINYRGVDSVNSAQQLDLMTVNAPVSAGQVSLTNGAFQVGILTPVTYTNLSDLTVAAPGNTISVNDVNLGMGTLSLSANQVNDLSGAGTAGVTANELVFSTVNSAGSGIARISTSINRLSVINSGDVYIGEQDTLDLVQMNTSGRVDIEANDQVSNSGVLLSNGVLSISTPGDILLNAANMLSGPLYFNANNVSLVNGTTTDLAGITAQNLTIGSAGNITDSGTVLVAGVTSLTSTGNITLNTADNDFNAVNISNAYDVTIYDINNIAGGNLTANSVTLNTQTGVANSASPLVTSTANVTINNATSGGVYVQNNRNVQVSITNIGDIYFYNNGNVVVERLYTNGGNYSSGLSQYIGDVRLTTSGGLASAYTGVGAHDQYSAPDIVGENLYVETITGDLGSVGRPMSVRVNDNFTFIGARGYVFYYGGRPNTVVGASDLVEFTGITGISGQQLIEIESLGEVDEAVFTDVRNYYHEDVAIMLPADQRMTEDDDENERKRREAVN